MEIDSTLRPRPRRLMLNAFVALDLVLLSVASAFAYRFYVRSSAFAAELAHLQASAQPVKRITRPFVEPEVVKRWKAIKAEADFEWYPVFRALEAANNQGIELLEFSPDKPGRRIVFRGEAKDHNALTTYVAALSAQPVFHELYLAHQKVVRRQGMDILTFEVRARISG
ncbi:MAG: PilN domain-containing protein [Telluria sp.]